MLLVLVGMLIIAIPIGIAFRTVLKLTRDLGAIDSQLVAKFIEHDPARDLEPLRKRLARQAPSSVAHRLIAAASGDHPAATLLERRLSLAEAVAEIERDVVDDLRVPRVAASLATTGGLLAAALVMREGLGTQLPEGADPLPHFTAVIERGLTLAAVAVLGGIACAALHRVAQRERRARLSELDALTTPLAARLEP